MIKNLLSQKLKFALGIAMSMALVGGAQADDPDKMPAGFDVIKKSVEAMGGAAKFKALKSMSATGTLNIPMAGIEGKMETVQVFPNMMRTKVDLGAQAGESNEGVMGNVAWEMSSMQGNRVLSEKETIARLESMNQMSSYDPASFYKSAKTVGTEDVGKEKCYKVAVETKNGNKETHFYSIKSGMPLKKISTTSTPMGEIEIASEPTDFRDVNGVMTPFVVKQSMPGISFELKFDKIEYNIEVDKSKFELPPEIKKIAEKMEARKKEKAEKESKEKAEKEKVPATSDK